MEGQTEIGTGTRWCLFETAIGPCGIAWSEHGVTRLQLPEADRNAAEQRLRRTAGGNPQGAAPPEIARVIADVQLYMSGQRMDFRSVALDLSGIGEFERTIYDAARAIPWGQTTSYGDLARRVGLPEAAREVGRAMGRNPVPVIIPCHRVLARGDRLGGFSAHGGIATKERLLVLEGLRLI